MAGRSGSGMGALHIIKARLLQEASALSEAVSQLGNEDAQADTDLDERARRTQSQLGELLGEVARGLCDFEAKLQGPPVMDGMLEALDERLCEHQAAAQCMVDAVLQDHQAVGTSAIEELQRDIGGFMAEVSTTHAAIWLDAAELQRATQEGWDVAVSLHDRAVERVGHLQEQHALLETGVEMLARSMGAVMQDAASFLEHQHAADTHSISSLIQATADLAAEFTHVQQAVLQSMSHWEQQGASSMGELHRELQVRQVLTEEYTTENRRLVDAAADLNASLAECRQQLRASGEESRRWGGDMQAARLLADGHRIQQQLAEAALKSCMEALAASQATTIDKLRTADAQRAASTQLLQLSQDQVFDLRAACEAGRQQIQAAQQDIAAGLAREALLQERHDDAEYTAQSKDAVIDTHAAELHHAMHLQLRAKAGVMAVSQDAQSMMSLLSEALQGCRVDVGVTERMLLERLELIRTECLAVVHDLQDRLGALCREAGAQRSDSVQARQTEQLQWDETVRAKEDVIQLLTSNQAQCAVLAEQWRAKHDMQVEENNTLHQAAAEQLEQMKLSAEYHQREVSILQARIAEEIEDWCLKLSIERQRTEQELGDLNTSWETTLKDSCAALQKEHEQDSEGARAMLVEQHKAEAASLEAAWAADRQVHACSLDQQQALHTDEMAEMTQRHLEDLHHALEQHVAACIAIEEKGAAELSAAVKEADVQSRANLQQVVKHHAEEIMQVRAACQDQLAFAHLQLDKQKRENHIAAEDLVQWWQRRCDDMRESLLAAQSSEHASMRTAHEIALSHLQQDHAALVTTLRGEAGRLEEALVHQQTTNQVAMAEHHSALALLQGSLMADHQAAMNSIAEQCRYDIAEQANTAATQLQAAAAVQAAALDAAKKAALEQSLQHEAHVQDLQEQLVAVQRLFDNRYPRKEDLQRIRELTSALAGKNAEAADLHRQVGERDSKLQRLNGELLLREDNYNRTFANGGAGMRVLDVSQAMSAQQTVTDWMLKPSSPSKKGPAAPKPQQNINKR